MWVRVHKTAILLGVVSVGCGQPPPTPADSFTDTSAGSSATDAGEATTSEDSGDSESGEPDPGAEPNLAFVTSQAYVAGELGGLDGADEICRSHAEQAGLEGEFVAWLSTTSVDGGDRLDGARAWVRTDGRPFVDRAEDLFERRQSFPLRLDEDGQDVGPVLTATATTHFGTKRIEDGIGTCDDWTNSAAVLRHISGRADAGAGLWTAGVSIPCDDAVHLYCFGIDRNAELDIEVTEGRVAFLSTGEFEPQTGRSSADALCASEASAAGLGGEFSALLSGADTSAIGAFTLDGPTWVRTDGTPIVEEAGDLASGSNLLSPISFHANDTPVFNVLVWTGGDSPGASPNLSTCSDWSASTGSGVAVVAGRSAPDWFAGGPRDCGDASLRVYCFER